MLIRKATAQELLSLWGEKGGSVGPTARFFCEHIQSGNAAFWAYEKDGTLFGECYVFKNLEDKDFADGSTRAYLCAFRIAEPLRRQGYGTRLISHVMEAVKAEGFQAVTIGVDPREAANMRLYRRLGFTEKVKDCTIDPCARGKAMRPKACSTFQLLMKYL